jgi:hypothetical protein
MVESSTTSPMPRMSKLMAYVSLGDLRWPRGELCLHARAMLLGYVDDDVGDQ